MIGLQIDWPLAVTAKVSTRYHQLPAYSNTRQKGLHLPSTISASYGLDVTSRQRLLADANIIRNRAKVGAAVTNAQAFLAVQQEFGSFDRYIWQFTDGQTRLYPLAENWDKLRVSSPESDAMSADLKQRGFKFVGTVTCYAYMQSIGMVDDHLMGCPRHAAR
ncbi:MAG: DNA-3-methyladenine glycosylase I [Candidatus Marinimicrobia bacterium]|nr:DNA-3-methyladenine glycosylase I [Candidatus Neomarinimicrobiota bacterium]